MDHENFTFDDWGNHDFVETLPTKLRDWLVHHPNPTAEPIWSDVANCTMGSGDGVPVAHIPVNKLTSSATKTVFVDENYETHNPSTESHNQSFKPTGSAVSSKILVAATITWTDG